MKFECFRSRSIILLYHRIASVQPDPWSLCVTPQHFAEHLDVLHKYRRTRLDQLQPGGWSVDRGLSVAITFDDGYADNFLVAQRLLMQHDTPATFFIATGCIDAHREFWWDELERIVFQSSPTASMEERYFSLYERLQPLSHEARRRVLDQMLTERGQPPVRRPSRRTLTSEELKELASESLFEIGAHTVTHPVLAEQPMDVQEREIRDSKEWLESFLRRPITSFSYPHGGKNHYTAATVRAVRHAGFSRACTTEFHPIGRRDSPWEWGRLQVSDIDGEQFEKLLFT